MLKSNIESEFFASFWKLFQSRNNSSEEHFFFDKFNFWITLVESIWFCRGKWQLSILTEIIFGQISSSLSFSKKALGVFYVIMPFLYQQNEIWNNALPISAKWKFIHDISYLMGHYLGRATSVISGSLI